MQELIKAIQTNNLDSLKELITKGANFKEIDQIGDTILHLACRVGQLPTVQYLVENCGLNINAENNKGTTPLYEAYITNNFPVIEYLEKRGAVTSSENNEVFYMNELHDAAAKGDLEEAKLLVEKYRASVDARGYGNGTYDEWVLPIHLACRYGHLEMVKYLAGELDCLLWEDDWGQDPIEIAEAEGHQHIVEYLKWLKNDKGK